MELQTIIFIGRSGAGKGMQSEHLKRHLAEHSPDAPVLYIETGTHFRKHIQDDSYSWSRARSIQENGGRQPDFLAVWIWAGVFLNEIRGTEHLVFDGMPRSVTEARILDTAFPFYERKSPTVVFLNVSEKWAEERLRARGRADDLNPEVVAKRLAFFTKDVAPAVDYYRENPNYHFVEINGEQTPEAVFSDIRKAVGI